MNKPPPIIVTERLRLRQAVIEDAEFLLALMSEPAWHQYIAKHTVDSMEKAVDYIESRLITMYHQQGFGLWVVEVKTDCKSIGLCGLLKRPWLAHIDLGFAFLQQCWGKGYAQEAAKACLQFACKTLNATRVDAITVPENKRSIQALTKLGFNYLSNRQKPDSDEMVALYQFDCHRR